MSTNPISIAEYVSDELDARGWTLWDVIRDFTGDRDENYVWLSFICEDNLWQDGTLEFTQVDAEKLAKIFGTSAELFVGLNRKFLEDLAAQRETIKRIQAELDEASERGAEIENDAQPPMGDFV